MMIEPKLRFKADDGSDFPDWEEKTLGDEGKFYGGLSGKTKEDFETGDAHFVTYMNVYKNVFASQDMMGCVNVGANERQNRVLYGDLLFTQSSETVEEVGLSSVYLHDDEPYLNSFCMGYRFNSLEDVSPEFIGYCMRSGGVRKSIMFVGQGISRINLGAKRLETVSYRLPSLPEQHKIADLLSAVDDVIAAQEAEVAAWEKRKKGVMQKLFSQEVRFKADDGSDFPDWKEKTLGDLGVFIRGLAYDKTQTVETDGIAVMRSNNIGLDGTLDYENEVRLVSKEPSEKQLLRKNDIVICTANGSRLVGKAAKYDGGYKEPSRITVGAFCGIFRSSDPVLPWWFQSDGYQRFLYSVKQGGNGALTNINGKAIESINVMLPTSIDEQRKIADCLASMDEVIRKSKNELAKWQELKKGLLQQMFV